MLHVPDVDVMYEELWLKHVEPHVPCKGTGRVVKGDDPMDTRHRPCSCLDQVNFRCDLLDGHVPPEFWGVESLVFELNVPARAFVDAWDLREARRMGAGILMTGENGVGKTACACIVLCRAARLGYSVSYMTVQQFVISHFAAQRDRGLEAWRTELLRADFMVLDEVGKEHRKEGGGFALTELDGLIRWRYADIRPTIFCTNFTASQVKKVYGESLWSIIQDRASPLNFESGDFRKLRSRRRRRG